MKREDFSAQKHTNMHASRNDLSETCDSFGSGFIFILFLLFFFCLFPDRYNITRLFEIRFCFFFSFFFPSNVNPKALVGV